MLTPAWAPVILGHIPIPRSNLHPRSFWLTRLLATWRSSPATRYSRVHWNRPFLKANQESSSQVTPLCSPLNFHNSKQLDLSHLTPEHGLSTLPCFPSYFFTRLNPKRPLIGREKFLIKQLPLESRERLISIKSYISVNGRWPAHL